MAKKNKRIKPEIMSFRNLKEVNNALFEIAQLRLKLKAIEAEAEEMINEIKRSTASESEKFIRRIKEIEKGITAFSEYNKEEIFSKDKKSIELQFGILGYRKSSKISIKKSTLDKLKELGFMNAIRIKESVNKEELLKWPDERLTLVDAKKVIKDKFWYEIKEEEIISHTIKHTSIA